MKHTMMKALSVVMVLAMIMGTFGALLVSGAECNHANAELIEKVDPTCGTYGYTLYECDDCGETYITNVVAKKTEHTGLKEVAAVEVSCESPAMTAGVICEDCGWDDEAPVAITPDWDADDYHVWEFFVVDPTCETDAALMQACKVCGLEEEVDLNISLPNGDGKHTYYYEIVKAPTCNVNGYATQLCEDCDYKLENVVVRANRSYTATWDGLHVWAKIDQKLTCTTDERKGLVCTVCDELNVYSEGYKYTKATGHNMVPATDADLDDIKKVDKDATAVSGTVSCTEDAYVWSICSVCGLCEKTITARAIGHRWADATNANIAAGKYVIGDEDTVDCETSVYNLSYCLNGCGADPKKELVKAAWGHKYEYGYSCSEGCEALKCNDCTHADRVYGVVCTREECNGISAAVLEKLDLKEDEICTSTSHVFSTTITKMHATCNAYAFNAYLCTIPGCEQYKAILQGEDGYVDYSDEGFWVDTDHSENYHSGLVSVVTDPTCVAEGFTTHVCKNCNVDGWTTDKKAALGHTPGDPVGAKDATCTEKGKTGDVFCTVCNEKLSATKDIAIDKNAHPEASLNLVEERVATCTLTAWAQYKCADCEGFVVVTGDKDATNHKYYVNGVLTDWGTTYTDAVLHTDDCTKDGTHGYTSCAGCKAMLSFDGTGCTRTGCTHEFFAIPGYVDHDVVQKIAAVNPSCNAYGVTKKTGCSRCDAVDEGGETLLPTGVYNSETGKWECNPDKFVTYEETAPTCTAYGWHAGTFCSVCRKTCIDAGCAYQGKDHRIAALGHKASSDTVNEGSVQDGCDSIGYTVYDCPYCTNTTDGEALYIDNYRPATEHNYPKNYDTNEALWDKTTFVPVVGTNEYCTEDGFYVVWCENGCGEYKVVGDPVKAAGHKYEDADGGLHAMSFKCNEYTAYLGLECVYCHAIVSDKTVEHNFVDKYEAPTCKADGYDIRVCLDCDKSQIHAEYEMIDHIPASIVEGSYVPATATAPGTITCVCAMCGEEFVIELPSSDDIDFEFDASAWVEGLGAHDGALVNGGKLVVTLKVSATAFVFRGFDLDFEYDTDALTFDKFEVKYAFDAAQGVQLKVTDADGSLKVSCYSSTGVGVDGVDPNVIIAGDDIALVDIYFDVNAGLGIVDYVDEDMILTNDYMIDWTGDSYWVVNEDGDTVYDSVTYSHAWVDTEFDLPFALVGDVNGDVIDAFVGGSISDAGVAALGINMGDVVAMLDVLYSADAGYVAAADLDRNGVVDIVDLALLENLIATDSVVDYLALAGVDFATMFEDMLREKAAHADVNGDTKSTEADYGALLLFIEAEASVEELYNNAAFYYVVSGDEDMLDSMATMLVQEAAEWYDYNGIII